MDGKLFDNDIKKNKKGYSLTTQWIDICRIQIKLPRDLRKTHGTLIIPGGQLKRCIELQHSLTFENYSYIRNNTELLGRASHEISQTHQKIICHHYSNSLTDKITFPTHPAVLTLFSYLLFEYLIISRSAGSWKRHSISESHFHELYVIRLLPLSFSSRTERIALQNL